MVLWNPLFLVAASPGSSDCTDRCADCRNSLALLRLGSKGEVGVVAESSKDAGDDKVCRQAVGGMGQDAELVRRSMTYSLRSKKEPSGSTTVTMES